jgi:GNAT superfamily N-acetyltransferase
VPAVEAHLLTGDPPGGVLDAARSVYAAAFAQAPYDEGPAEADAFVERTRRYARDRDGPRLALVEAGGPVGVGLAVLARPGDWWRDRAAAAVAPDDARRWIGAECLEVVHVAVHPRAQGRGLGRLVHDLLIAGRPAATGILACDPAAGPARGLYTARGWRVLTDRFDAAGAGRTALLMARQL